MLTYAYGVLAAHLSSQKLRLMLRQSCQPMIQTEPCGVNWSSFNNMVCHGYCVQCMGSSILLQTTWDLDMF